MPNEVAQEYRRRPHHCLLESTDPVYSPSVTLLWYLMHSCVCFTPHSLRSHAHSLKPHRGCVSMQSWGLCRLADLSVHKCSLACTPSRVQTGPASQRTLVENKFNCHLSVDMGVESIEFCCVTRVATWKLSCRFASRFQPLSLFFFTTMWWSVETPVGKTLLLH